MLWMRDLKEGVGGAPEDLEPDRVDLRHRSAADQGHERPGQSGRRAGHGVQVVAGRGGALALRQRRPPGRSRPSRRQVREGSAGEAARADRSRGRRVIVQGTWSTTIEDFSLSCGNSALRGPLLRTAWIVTAYRPGKTCS